MSDGCVKVALIDDDGDDHLLIKDLLNSIAHSDYELHWFPSSQAGLNALKQLAYDVYLIDYRLDAKTGLDLLDEIQKQDIRRSIILLTGKGGHEVDVAAMNMGASDFLPKELMTPESLERSIRYCIKRAQDQEKIKEAERIKYEKETLERASQAKTLFLANMSHEIRTPLGAILGFTELAMEPDVSENEKAEFLKTIHKNGEHLLELINDILDLSKVEAGKIKFEHIDFNWRETVLEVIETFQPKIRTKPLEIFFEADPGIPLLLKGDPHKFRQILINLIGNSAKFTEKGVIKIKCSTEVREDRKFIELDVIDTGIGISEKDQKKLFQPFQQANPSLTRQYGGTGLGLDLSKKLARAQGGDVVLLSSAPGRGSTFRLFLPAEFHDGPDLNISASKPQRPSSNEGRKISILLVEDAIENQIIVKGFLKNSNFEIECANDGIEGIKKAKGKDYDLILMDVQLPLLDGMEATRILRDAGYKKPIVALTANALKEDREKALANGFTEYVTKPIRKHELKQTIDRACQF